MKYKDIAEKYEVSINTVKSWKQRNGWSRDGTENGAPKKIGTQKGIKAVALQKEIRMMLPTDSLLKGCLKKHKRLWKSFKIEIKQI